MRIDRRLLSLQCLALGELLTFGQMKAAYADAIFSTGHHVERGGNPSNFGYCHGVTDGAFDWWTMEKIGVDCAISGPNGYGFDDGRVYDNVTALHQASAWNQASYFKWVCQLLVDKDTVSTTGIIYYDAGTVEYDTSAVSSGWDACC